MTTTFLASTSITFSGSSGATRTFSYTPSGLGSAGFVDCFTIFWPTTSSRTVSSITGSGCTFTVGTPQIVWTAESFIVQTFMVTATTTGARTCTATFSGTISSAATNFSAFQEGFQTNNTAPNWQVDGVGWVNGPTVSTTSLTSASVVVPLGDFLFVNVSSATSSPTGSSNPLSWLTYNDSEEIIWGDAPSLQNPLPQTGFALASQSWITLAMVLKPGPLPAQYVPQVVSGYGSII